MNDACPNKRHHCSNRGEHTTVLHGEDKDGKPYIERFCQVCGEKWGRAAIKAVNI